MSFNKNMLSPAGFSFHIKKLPEMNFFVQTVDMPGVVLGYGEQPTPFKKLPVYGDHYEYSGDLTITFKVNEDLSNYISVYEWLRGIAFPDEFKQFADLKEKDPIGEGIETDAYLMIMSSAMQPTIRIDFEQIFPVSLSNILLDTKDSSLEYIDATADFKFKSYNFTSI